MNKTFIKIGVLTILSLSLIVVAFSLPPNDAQPANAQVAPGFLETPFGGKRQLTINCNCSGGQLIYIFDYGTFSVLPLLYKSDTTIPYPLFSPFATFFLGSYQKGVGICRIRSGLRCRSLIVEGTMGNLPGVATTPF